MMGKFTVWIVLAGLAWLGWTLWRIGRRRSESAASRQPAADSARPEAPGADRQPSDPPPEPMVCCAHCRLYLPARDAVAGSSGQLYCSTAHRDVAARTPREPSASP